MSKKSIQIELFVKKEKIRLIKPIKKQEGYNPFQGWIIQPRAYNARITTFRNKAGMRKTMWPEEDTST